MRNSIRIGGAGGFWGDSPAAIEQLVSKGDVDYIILDYLAELTMAIMAKQKARDADAGFATDFVTLALKPVLREVANRKIKIVTNAGGINPRACARALEKLAADSGVPVKVGVVEGDDLMPAEQGLRTKQTREMFSGEPLPPRVTSMNAYIGAFPIARALKAGADIIITGRCADSALALGPLIHEFGWHAEDFDLLAAGSMAGHIIECGTQTTGGLFTDWEMVKGRADLGYPIAQCYSDGRFRLTKPRGTGGLITPLVAAEQMLYEVGNPGDYLLPDVTCDLTSVSIRQVDAETVEFSNVKGRAPTGTYKVSATYLDGYRATATLTMVGRNASEKAQVVGDAILERTRNLLRGSNLGDFTETNIEALGSERATFGDNALGVAPREVVLRISVRHPSKEAISLFGREIAPFGTAGTPGTTGFSGRPKPQEVYRLFSFLVDKKEVAVTVTVDGKAVNFIAPEVGGAYSPAPASAEVKPNGAVTSDCVEVPLRSVAVARSGDKANISHLAIIARHEDFHDVLRDQLTVERLRGYFDHLVDGDVFRYDVPGINALNFMLHEALGGGGTATLRNDALGKAFGEIALDMPIRVPACLLNHASFRAAA